jgi:2-phosphoglycerate kinase
MVQVRKRDGRLEDYNRQKLYQSVIAAGLSETEADSVADQITNWVQQSDEVVSTQQIRDRVIQFLEINNPEVSEKYKSYKKV